jgi:hypothetical protein
MLVKKCQINVKHTSNKTHQFITSPHFYIVILKLIIWHEIIVVFLLDVSVKLFYIDDVCLIIW